MLAETSTSSTTRRGLRRHAAGARSAPARPSGAASCAGCGAGRRRRAATSVRRVARRSGGRGRSARIIRSSSAFWSALSEATSRWRSTSASDAAAWSSVVLGLLAARAGLVADRQRGRHLARLLARRRARQPLAGRRTTPRRPGRSAPGRRARRTASPGPRRTSPPASPSPTSEVAVRKLVERSWVTLTPAERSARAKPSRISSGGCTTSATGVLIPRASGPARA